MSYVDSINVCGTLNIHVHVEYTLYYMYTILLFAHVYTTYIMYVHACTHVPHTRTCTCTENVYTSCGVGGERS